MKLGIRLRRWLFALEQGSGGYCTPMVTVLLAVNSVIFFAALLSGGMNSPVVDALVCDPRTWDGQVWRPLTGAVLHGMTMHWFFNMLMLFFFGGLVERFFGSRDFALLVLVVAVVANLFHLGIMQTGVLGFSGVDYALLVAFATIAPRARVIFFILRVPAWALALIWVGLDVLLLTETRGHHGTAYLVHLSGAAMGFCAVAGAPLARRWRQRWQQRQLASLHRQDHVDQAKIDRLLEKVSAEGLPALTADERRFLQETSQRQRRSGP